MELLPPGLLVPQEMVGLTGGEPPSLAPRLPIGQSPCRYSPFKVQALGYIAQLISKAVGSLISVNALSSSGGCQYQEPCTVHLLGGSCQKTSWRRSHPT